MTRPSLALPTFLAYGGLLLAACDNSDHKADLPAGWEGAQRVDELIQMPCAASALGGDAGEAMAAVGEQGTIAVSYDHAHFRCVQDVEGFMRVAGDAIDLLVQPIDMNPTAVAGCDCLYDITMSLPAPAGAHDVTLYRRWDNINMPNDPVKIGSADVVVK